MPIHRILIVEDDAALRATLAEQLLATGDFLPEEAAGVADAAAKLSTIDAPTMPSCSTSACPTATAATCAPSCGGTA
jgi:CheY-like chemotaxis protein